MASWAWAHLSTVYVQTPGRRVPALLVRQPERGEWVLEISFKTFLAAGGQLTPRTSEENPWAGWVVESPRAVPLVAVPGGPVAGTPRGPEQQAAPAVARAVPASPAPCASYCAAGAAPSVTPPLPPPTAAPTYPPAGGCGSASAPGVCVAAPSAPTGEAPPSSTLPPTPRPAFPADLVPRAERLTSQYWYCGLSGRERLRRAFRAGLSDHAALRAVSHGFASEGSRGVSAWGRTVAVASGARAPGAATLPR